MIKRQRRNSMRVIISASGKELDSEVDGRFGRCPYYLVVDIDAKQIKKVEVVKNKGEAQGHGAGFAAAQQVGDMKPDYIITGNIGPNASNALQQLGITVYSASGKIRDVIQQLLDGKLVRTDHTVPGHSGANTSADDKQKSNEAKGLKKLAISTDDEEVAVHFGRCKQFTIVEIHDGKVAKKEVIDNPGHTPGQLPKFLSDIGVNYLIAGSAGPLAQDYLKEYDIKMILGVEGKVDKVIKEFIEDSLELGDSIAKPGEGKGSGIDREE